MSVDALLHFSPTLSQTWHTRYPLATFFPGYHVQIPFSHAFNSPTLCLPLVPPVLPFGMVEVGNPYPRSPCHVFRWRTFFYGDCHTLIFRSRWVVASNKFTAPTFHMTRMCSSPPARRLLLVQTIPRPLSARLLLFLFTCIDGLHLSLFVYMQCPMPFVGVALPASTCGWILADGLSWTFTAYPAQGCCFFSPDAPGCHPDAPMPPLFGSLLSTPAPSLLLPRPLPTPPGPLTVSPSCTLTVRASCQRLYGVHSH